MKCFYHQDVDAVGICKSCQKGVCMDCLVEVGHSIACRSTCEEHVGIVDAMVNKSIVTVSSQKKYSHFTPLFLIACGISILFLFFSIDGKFGLPSLLGFVLIGFGVFNHFLNRRLLKEMEE